MIKVVFWEVPAGAISRFQNDQWDHEPVLTLHHLLPKWVPAHVSESDHIWLQSGTELTVELPRIQGPSANAIEGAYAEMMAKARETFIELVEKISPKVYDGTLALIHRGTCFGSFGLIVNFGLGFTSGNAFDEPPWFRPTERWCPKEIDFGPSPPWPYRRTIWERLNEECTPGVTCGHDGRQEDSCP